MDVRNPDFLSGEHPAGKFQVYSAGQSPVSFPEKHPALHYGRALTGTGGICAVRTDGPGHAGDWRVGVPEEPGPVCPVSVRSGYEQNGN